MAFEVVRSNSPEVLVRALALALESPSGLDLIEPETVVVQGKGMERWVSMQLAQSYGVHANIRYPFPAHIGRRAVESALGLEKDAVAQWSPGPLLWHVWEALDPCLSLEVFAPLRTYLEVDSGGRRRVQLCRQLARVFDDYNLYRPDWMADWSVSDGGPAGDWQPILWRSLVDRVDTAPLGLLEQAFYAHLKALPAGEDPFPDLPQELHFFAVSTLPPIHARILAVVARFRRVLWYALEPTPAYVADLKALDLDGLDESGHPLLATFGRAHRTFQAVQHSVGLGLGQAQEVFTPPGESTLLASLQADVFHLVQRGSDEQPRFVLADGQRPSIQFHACHGSMRQVEVLRDQLLALLSADATLQPRDIVVYTPDVERFAALVDAVFSAVTPSDKVGDLPAVPALPFTVADRSLRAENELAHALLAFVSLLTGRCSATEVLAVLGLDVVRRRFGIDTSQFDEIVKWTVETRVHWGVDAAHRAEEGQPAQSQNSWRWGLDRMVLGYAMPLGPHAVDYGLSPYDRIEGSETEALAALLSFWEQVVRWRDDLRSPRSMADWSAALLTVLDALSLAHRERGWQARQVRQVLEELSAHAGQAGCTQALGLDAVRTLLEGRFGETGSATGFGSGRITLTQMVPLRGVPYRVVAFLGMDEGAFPRLDRRPAFDKLAADIRLGDRSGRDEDRSLFLDALLSAREEVIVCYAGRSLQTDEPIAPCVPVVELIEVLVDGSTVGGAQFGSDEDRRDAVRSALVHEHPMQPFSPRCFGADPAAVASLSHDQALGAGAVALQAALQDGSTVEQGFFRDGALALSDEDRVVSIDQLLSFFDRPVRYLLTRRLGVVLSRPWREVNDREPAGLDAGSAERWIGKVVAARLAGHEAGALADWVQAQGGLPLGQPGALCLDAVLAGAESLVQRLRAVLPDNDRRAVDLDLSIGPFRLVGRVPDVGPSGVVRSKAGKVWGSDRLAMWIAHLAVHAQEQDRGLGDSRLVAIDKQGALVERVYRPPDDALAALERLLERYWEGLSGPLLYFSQSSAFFGEKYFGVAPEKRDLDKARSAAATKWYGWSSTRKRMVGESLQTAHLLAFGAPDVLPVLPWSDGFSLPGAGDMALSSAVDVAIAIWQPVASHETEEAP